MVEKKRTRKSTNAKKEKQSAAKSAEIPKIEHQPISAAPSPAAEKKETGQKGSNQKYIVIGIIVILAAAILYILLFQLPSISGASFTAFKTNFNDAPRIAVTVLYHNNSQWPLEEPCYTRLLDVLSGVRGASSIDFFLVNQTSCTYSPTGLGHAANYITKNASSCLSTAQSEPGIYLNFSNTYNKTTITPTHLYINANQSYYNSCPIATEFA